MKKSRVNIKPIYISIYDIIKLGNTMKRKTTQKQYLT
jgi:hypothetical protein